MDAHEYRSASPLVQCNLLEPSPENHLATSPQAYTCIRDDYCGTENRGKCNCRECENKEERKEEENKEVITDNLQAVAVRCKCQFCEECAKQLCWKLRDKLRPHVKNWPRVSMITLTIDPKKFDSPQEAYEFIQGKRGVAELIRKMDRDGFLEDRRFFYAIEFHGNGWVHWHVAVIPTKVKHGKLNAGNYLYNSWGYGAVKESKGGIKDPMHAMNYLTKYVAKQEQRAPEWVLKYPGNFRKFSTSRGLCGGIVSRSIPKGGTRVRKLPFERMEACKKTTAFIRRRIRFTEDNKKETSYQFLGAVDAPLDKVESHPEWQNALVEWHEKGHVKDTWINQPFAVWRDSIDESSTSIDFRKYLVDLEATRHARNGEEDRGYR